MIAKYWDKLGQIGRGGNGIWQVPELLVIICMYLFTLYSLICICLMSVTDPELINTDPNLILTDGVWRPNSQSIVVGNATSNYPYVSNDMDGQSRDSNPDVGADEVSSATVTMVPLEKEDIGYNWTDPITPEVLSALNAIRSDIKLLVKNGTMTISGLEDSDFQRYLVSIPWMESTSRQIPFNQSCNFESAFRTLYHQTFK